MSFQRPDRTSEFDQQDINSNKGIACISYLGFLFLVPLLAAPNSKFAKFHANQGLLLFIALAAAGIAVSILTFVIGVVFIWAPLIASLLTSLIGGVFGIACFVIAILSLVDAANGKARELPFIGKYKLIV